VGWLGSLAVILVVAFTVGDTAGGLILIMILVVVEKLAYIWYTLAFWPGGHYAAKTMVSAMCSSLCGGG